MINFTKIVQANLLKDKDRAVSSAHHSGRSFHDQARENTQKDFLGIELQHFASKDLQQTYINHLRQQNEFLHKIHKQQEDTINYLTMIYIGSVAFFVLTLIGVIIT